MGLSIMERRSYLRLLSDQIQRENEEIEKLRRSWQ
jgi:hypothetical protein